MSMSVKGIGNAGGTVTAADGGATGAAGCGTEAAVDSEPPEWLRLDIIIDEDAAKACGLVEIEAHIERAARALAGHPEFSGEASALACIALASNAVVHDLNHRHRSKDRPTNVLSFPAPEGAMADGRARAFLGDVVLAAETVLAEARAQDLLPLHHFQHLVVHGLLHLLGFDHEQGEAEARAMESLETEILATLGIADPYAEPG